eukprot:9381239-Karenia_brevis.AAC.1
MIFHHVSKLFNITYWRMCVDDMCAHCTAVTQRRRLVMPDWHPKNVLSPLRHNFYRPILPEMPGDQTGPREGEEPSAGLKPETYDLQPSPISA